MLARVNNNLALLPWRSLAELQHEFMNSFADLDDMWRKSSFPRLSVEDGDKEIKVTACLPGCEQKDIDVEVVNDFITIKAVRRDHDAKDGEHRLRAERSFGEYEETLKLGSRIRSDETRATYKNGVLEVVLPKVEAPAPQRIAINA